jgi:hypothetical protein
MIGRCMTRHLSVGLGIVLLLGARAPAGAQAPVHRDVVQGRATTDSGAPVAGADVIVTMAPDRISEATKTDAAGRYALVFEHGTGDYLVHVSAVGYAPVRKRVTRTGAESVLTVDARLTRGGDVQRLAAVEVEAAPTKPERRGVGVPEDGVGAAERESQGVNGAVAPDQAGDLNAAAALVPGVAVTASGFSIGGLDPAQNSTTLNGMSFGGAAVPRDARTTVRVAASTYDPSRGWFSGANEDVTLAPGGLISTRRMHLTMDAPFLQANDPISAATGGRMSAIRASVGGDGSLLDDRFVYNYGVQASRRGSDVAALQRARPDVLARAGVAADSVARLVDILGAAGIPLSARVSPTSQVAQSLSIIGRLDHAPYDWSSFQPARTMYGLLGYAALERHDLVGLAPTATAAHAGRSTEQLGMLQGLFSTYFHGDWLTELRSSITIGRDRTIPYLALPGGTVLLSSTLGDEPGGVAPLQFGGNGALQSDRRRWTWETMSQTQFYARGRATHRVALSADARVDGVRNAGTGDPFGTFGFQSLADLAANTPSSFTRTLGTPDEAGRAWNAYIALGDLWRVSPTLQILYGARLEGNRFFGLPANNPAVTSAFGVRTDHAPNTVHVSPRLGFTWVRRASRDMRLSMTPFGPLSLNSASYIRGGIGEFRNLLSPSLLAEASSESGLPGGARTLTCIGSAVPTPDWNAYGASLAALPSTCLTSSATPSFADAAPPVQLFDRAYAAPRSWRANLAYSSSAHGWTYGVEGLLALNLDQPGRVDLNLDPTPRFTLAGEGRPVFVTPSSIVPSTGLAASSAARRNGAFGHVIDNVSSLRSTSGQLTFSLSPNLAGISNWFFSSAYTLGSNRAIESGFDGSTFGSPLGREWSRGDLDIRHQLLLQGGFATGAVTLTLFGRLQSGVPYTPMIAGDVNGDGFANDRAFILDPATATDTALASATRVLLAGSASRVRDCLTPWFGRAVRRNGCEGPWTASLNARLSYSGQLGPLGRRTRIALAFVNPLGGLDQLLHGSHDLRGWGSPSTPDAVLYTVRGFDPAAERFTYEVNPRFGSTRGIATAFRVPFRVTLDVSIDLTRDVGLQHMDRWLRPGRAGRAGKRLGVAELRERYVRTIPDPYQGILEESDSLLLTRNQSDSLAAIDTRYRAHMDTIWTALATYLAALPDHFDTKAVLERQESVVGDAWEYSRQDVKRTLPAVLSPVQLRILPWLPKMLYESKGRLNLQFITGG